MYVRAGVMILPWMRKSGKTLHSAFTFMHPSWKLKHETWHGCSSRRELMRCCGPFLFYFISSCRCILTIFLKPEETFDPKEYTENVFFFCAKKATNNIRLFSSGHKEQRRQVSSHTSWKSGGKSLIPVKAIFFSPRVSNELNTYIVRVMWQAFLITKALHHSQNRTSKCHERLFPFVRRWRQHVFYYININSINSVLLNYSPY